MLMSCTDVSVKRVSIDRAIEYEEKSNYRIEQTYFSGSFMTYVWYKRDIAESYSIDSKKVTKELIKRDSIKANNLIVRLEKIKP